MNKMTACFVSTDHLTDRLWFRDDDDFRTGMNYVAIVSYSLNTPILAFILMSNHVHFVLACDETDALRFITEFKRRYSQYYQKKNGTSVLLSHNNVDIQGLVGEESVERAIAYVQMNCVAANICSHPVQYPWGTGGCFYHVGENSDRALGELSGRAQRRLLLSQQKLPSSYLVTNETYINPGSYVSIQFVERLFRTPARYNYFLRQSSKARIRLESNPLPSFRDQNVIASVQDLCRSLFREEGTNDLTPDQMAELARQIRFRFSADASQIARVLSVSYEEAVTMLDKL